MKNLFLALSFGAAFLFTGTAFGQEGKKDKTENAQKKMNPRSNGKNSETRTFGQERAAAVHEMNGTRTDKENIGKEPKENKEAKNLSKKDKAAKKADRKLTKKQAKENRKKNQRKNKKAE